MSNLEEVLAALDPVLRKRLFIASEAPAIRFCKTPSVGLNAALNGGFAYGRQVLLWGNKSSGKSSLCLQMVGDAQREDKVCAWIDSEMAFDKDWATKLGVDCDRLIYSKAKTVNEFVDQGTSLMKAGVDILVVDSISSLLPAIYFEKDGHDLKDLDQTGQIGAFSKDMARALKMLNYANNQNNETLLVLISQVRTAISPQYSQGAPEGGNATKFYSSTIVKLFSSESDSNAIKSMVPLGDKLIERKIGRVVDWNVQFSKTSEPFQSGKYEFYFKGDKLGVDTIGELVDMAVDRGYLAYTKPGWYTLPDGTKIQGKPKIVSRIEKDPQLKQLLLEKINQ